MKIQAVIFDLDGTLVDSMWMWKDIDIEYLGRYQIPLSEEFQREIEREIEGKSFTETAVYFKERFQLPKTLEEIKEDWNLMAYEKYAHVVPLKPGAKEFLEFLKEKQIPCGIATSNSLELVTAALKQHGIFDYFSAIITGCMVQKGKPAPDVYLKAAEELHADPTACLVFEDVPMGILAGKHAGMTVCAVADRFSEDQLEAKKELADAFITSYDQVPKMFREDFT